MFGVEIYLVLLFWLPAILCAIIPIGGTGGILPNLFNPSAVCRTLSDTLGPSKVDLPLEILPYTLDATDIFSQTCVILPACAVHPTIAEDVAVAIRLISANRTPFAVRSGSHNTNPGAAGTTGVLMVMDKMDQVNVLSPTAVEVGPGARWGDVYQQLDKFGLSVVGGRISDVGVGGLSLGGGISHLSSQYGFTVDNVLSYEVVLPNATLATVTPASDPDLWFALRGGGNKFGVVTKFTFKARPQGKVHYGTVYYSDLQCEEYFKAVMAFTLYNTDPKAAVIPTYVGLSAGVKLGIMYLFYDAPTLPSDIWKNFTTIPHLNITISPRSYWEVAYPLEDPVANLKGLRRLFRTTTFEPVTAALGSSLYAIASQSFTTLSLRPGFVLASLALEPIDRNMLQRHASFGPAAWATPNDGGPQLLIELHYVWADSLSDSEYNVRARNDIQAMQDMAIGLGQMTRAPWLYPAYAQVDQPVEEVFSGTLERLSGVQRRVDPLGVFRKLTGGHNI
ncbi:hypothetical protein HDV00_010746 [Rhizophlyctis rosea]|nr:hypothetical protein HDV00_010746 [Rhizophlyctis rosea]